MRIAWIGQTIAQCSCTSPSPIKVLTMPCNSPVFSASSRIVDRVRNRGEACWRIPSFSAICFLTWEGEDRGSLGTMLGAAFPGGGLVGSAGPVSFGSFTPELPEPFGAEGVASLSFRFLCSRLALCCFGLRHLYERTVGKVHFHKPPDGEL